MAKMVRQTDLYTSIHKAHRYALYTMAIQAGRTDYSEESSLERLNDLLAAFREQLRIHIEAEETFIHPLLSRRIPGGARDLEEEHRLHSEQFENLINHLEEIRALPEDFERLGEIGLEHYRALNRFIAGYLAHLDREEEDIQPALWRPATEDELLGALGGYLSGMRNITPEDAGYLLKIMVPAYDPDELRTVFERAEGAPKEAREMLYALTESMLSTKELAAVKKRFEER